MLKGNGVNSKLSKFLAIAVVRSYICFKAAYQLINYFVKQNNIFAQGFPSSPLNEF